MKIRYTNEGVAYTHFQDHNYNHCSIQASSVAVDCIWLGVNENRMHLTRGHVADMLPLLSRFAETGKIDENKNEDID